MKQIGIGESDFRNLIQEGCLFVDKSLFIQEVISSGAKIILIPRPRRFGKTLNLTMLRYFLERQEELDKQEEHRRLFDGLAIRETPEFEKHCGKYPVIYLTFKDVKQRKFEAALMKIKRLLCAEVKRHLASWQDKIHFNEIWVLDEIANRSDNTGYYEDSISILSDFLHQSAHVPPIILIDEYDTPIHAAWQYGYYDEMIAFMRGLLSGGLKDNPHIYKGVITGILRVAKESIFSDLNNMDIYTILEKPFSDKFGITKQELDILFSEYDMKDRLVEANSWYNGYLFGDNVIFNPWSILNFINHHPAHPEPYWANTSSNALIKELVINGGIELRDSIEKFINGESIDSVIDKNIVFPEISKKERYIYSLFFFSGYLKCISMRRDEENLVCSLAIPNREVRYIFRNIIAGWLEESFGNRKLTTMLKALVTGNLDQFQRLLNEFVITTLSFFDTKGRNPEAVYQAFVLGMLLNLGQDYEISSNRELGYGRYDILAVPRHDRSRPAILMEMKSITGFYQEDPQKAISEAVDQIGKRAYAKELEARGFDNVLKIVVVSDGKKVWVKTVSEDKGEAGVSCLS